MMRVVIPVREASSFRDFERVDDAAILENLHEFQRIFQDSTTSVDHNWILSKIVLKRIRRCVPLRKKRQKHTNTWITRYIIHLKRKISRTRLKRKTVPNSLTTYIRSLGSEFRPRVKGLED